MASKMHPELYQYLPKKITLLNSLLFQLDAANSRKESGDTHFLCDISGVCEADNPEEDDTTSNCFFCGTELIKHANGNWYHHSAYDDDGKLIDERYQTHGYGGSKRGDPTTEEERDVMELKQKIDELVLTLNI